LANEFLTSRLPRFTAVGGLSIYANITVAEEVSGESKSSVLLTKPNEPAERLKNRSNDVMSPRNWQENPAFTKVNELRLGEAVVFRGRSGIALAMK
jgi:hypothetical protein